MFYLHSCSENCVSIVAIFSVLLIAKSRLVVLAGYPCHP